jgi:hypothetical protein
MKSSWKLLVLRAITSVSLGYALSALFPHQAALACFTCDDDRHCVSTSGGWNICFEQGDTCNLTGDNCG